MINEIRVGIDRHARQLLWRFGHERVQAACCRRINRFRIKGRIDGTNNRSNHACDILWQI